MSRRVAPEDSSLELLLDTICNTFGGILFLAMLVALLLTQTQRRTSTESHNAAPRTALTPAEVARLERRAQDLQEESRRIESLIDDLQRMTERLFDPKQAELARRLANAEARIAVLESERAALLARIADAQASAVRASTAAADDAKRLERTRSAVKAAEQRLAEAKQARATLLQTASTVASTFEDAATIETAGKAPRERETDKRELAVMLKYGRLYQMHRFSGDDRSVNTTDFIVREDDDYNRARPRPSAGIDLTAAGAADRVSRMFTSFPRQAWYACLVVHPDSFAEFLALKTWLVSHGYEYRLFPAAEPVVDRGAGPRDARVQ
jgi:uncharacterized protein YlxW (UPF0749 family)